MGPSYAEALLGHPIPAKDLEEILDGAFLAYVAKLEKCKFAATSRPHRGAKRSSNDPRHIPVTSSAPCGRATGAGAPS
jgi:hypothetical protein